MTKLKKLDVTIMSSMNLSLLILKISFLTLFGCGVNIHKINPIFGYRVKIIPDLIKLKLQLLTL